VESHYEANNLNNLKLVSKDLILAIDAFSLNPLARVNFCQQVFIAAFSFTFARFFTIWTSSVFCWREPVFVGAVRSVHSQMPVTLDSKSQSRRLPVQT